MTKDWPLASTPCRLYSSTKTGTSLTEHSDVSPRWPTVSLDAASTLDPWPSTDSSLLSFTVCRTRPAQRRRRHHHNNRQILPQLRPPEAPARPRPPLPRLPIRWKRRERNRPLAVPPFRPSSVYCRLCAEDRRESPTTFSALNCRTPSNGPSTARSDAFWIR